MATCNNVGGGNLLNSPPKLWLEARLHIFPNKYSTPELLKQSSFQIVSDGETLINDQFVEYSLNRCSNSEKLYNKFFH